MMTFEMPSGPNREGGWWFGLKYEPVDGYCDEDKRLRIIPLIQTPGISSVGGGRCGAAFGCWASSDNLRLFIV
jgi:hypothetical protein